MTGVKKPTATKESNAPYALLGLYATLMVLIVVVTLFIGDSTGRIGTPAPATPTPTPSASPS